jgi:hypothetical protein
MIKRVPFVVVTVVAIALQSGCSRTLRLDLPANTPIELRTFVIDTPGSAEAARRNTQLQPDSAEHRRLREWLAQNQTGWAQSYSTTPRQGLIVQGRGFSLHFVADVVFASTAEGQFEKKVREQDYAYLKAPLGI